MNAATLKENVLAILRSDSATRDVEALTEFQMYGFEFAEAQEQLKKAKAYLARTQPLQVAVAVAVQEPEPETQQPVEADALADALAEAVGGAAQDVDEVESGKPQADLESRYAEYCAYLTAIFRPGDVLCFVSINHTTDLTLQIFATLEDALIWESFQNLIRDNANASIYVAMNTYPASLVGHRKGRTQENVVEVRALQTDIDNVQQAEHIVSTMQSSAKVPPPSIVVESSTGKRQGVWLVDGISKEEAKPLMKAIAAEFGTDSAVAEIARVMRLPGFVNRKYTTEPVAKLLVNTGVRYTRDAFHVSAVAEKTERKPEGWLDEPFVRGGIYNQVLQVVGHYIATKNISDGEVMFSIVKGHIDRNGCYERDGKTRFHWNEEQVRQQCHKLVDEWETGEEQKQEAITKALAESAKVAEAAVAAAKTVPPLPEIDTSEGYTRPEFPYWAIMGTSIWEGLVAPALATSSKHAEFIAMPAIQIMLNQLSGKVRVGLTGSNFNIYVGLISPYGKFFKSSSCDLAMDYFRYIGLLVRSVNKKEVAGGRTAIIQAGSPEGFGVKARDTGATHALLFNDELGKFVSKAGIEGSAFSSDLLTWYGAGEFGNNTTQAKNGFHFEAGTYTFGWLWATTDRGFNIHWPKLAGISSGLEDRMFFVVSPKEPKPTTPYSDPIFAEGGSVRTRQLFDNAIQQGVFEFESPEWFAKKVSGMDPRSMDLVQKLSLYFCVDMGDTVINDEHVDRALALVAYRNQAALFLAPIEARDDGARMQKEILRELRQHRGKMRYRDLCRALDYTSVEVWKWNRIFQGLINEGLIFNFEEQTTPGKRPTRMTGLVKQEED